MRLQQLLLGSALSLGAQAIAIFDFESCPIPYIIPRSFQTKCDPSDSFVDEYMMPVRLGPGFNKNRHPQWITAASIRTKPNIWSHEPYCIESVDSNTGVCVYTSYHFGNGRGISFVASPKEHNLMIQAYALTHQNEFEPHVNPLNDTRMEMMPIPGKGLGVRSKTILLRGQTAQSYTPVLSVQDVVMQVLPQKDYALLLRQAVERLPPRSQKLFNDLWGHWGGNPDYDKINTNAFTAMIGASQAFFWSVYPETSRYNHDCRPNTMYSIESDTFVHNLRVSRQIIMGEEITLSYLSPSMTSHERSMRMQNQWGFNCSCHLCASPKHVLTASDERITLIDQLENELNDLSANRTAGIATAEFLVSLYEQERLDGVIGDAYMYAAFENSYQGRKRDTQKYAALALEHMAIWRGTDHDYYKAMHRLLLDPENQRSWRHFIDKKSL